MKKILRQVILNQVALMGLVQIHLVLMFFNKQETLGMGLQ